MVPIMPCHTAVTTGPTNYKQKE